ncbi:MAG: peptide chain release factor 1 [Planctomycetota bacterium]
MAVSERFLVQLEKMHARHLELEAMIASPEIIRHPQYLSYLREFGDLQKVMGAFNAYRAAAAAAASDRVMLEDPAIEPELAGMAREAVVEKEAEAARHIEAIKDAMYNEIAMADKVIVEIRAGTGGDEASLFAADLFRMYTAYFGTKRWRYEVFDSRTSDLKGYKNIVFSVAGRGVYAALQYESGGHRVQRVPVTEAGGRIHTSAATVAVMPEAEDIELVIEPKDLIIETMHASGPGGQNVNKVESAIRITHKPSGVVVSCQDGTSQHGNKERAMRVLKVRVFEGLKARAHQERGDLRRSLTGSGDRNERIRTYNFPQNRVTDHRINVSIYDLESFMNGELDALLGHLNRYYREQYFEQYEAGRT